MIDQAEEVVDQVFMRDPAELGAVAWLLARVVVADRLKAGAELIEQERVDLISRRNPGNDEERRTISDDPKGHAVVGPVPVADLGRGIICARPRRGCGPGRGTAGAPAVGRPRACQGQLSVPAWASAGVSGAAGA